MNITVYIGFSFSIDTGRLQGEKRLFCIGKPQFFQLTAGNNLVVLQQ